MRVFVTGASGFIGSAVVPELIAAGHQVVGLARSDASARAIEAAGAGVHRGSLEDPESLRAGAADSDGVIHLAFIHDFEQYEDAARTDRSAIDAMGEALKGSGKPLVVTSGMAVSGRDLITEHDEPDPNFARSAAAVATVALADKGIRSSVLRLPPTVHGRGDEGFVTMMIGTARKQQASAYIGDGSNRWPAVHRFDAARLFRLALEKAPAGSVLHAVGDEGIPIRAIADVIGRHLGVPAVSIPPEKAVEHFGWLGMILCADIAASSAITRQMLGWEPVEGGLLEDLDEGHYFSNGAPPL